VPDDHLGGQIDAAMRLAVLGFDNREGREDVADIGLADAVEMEIQGIQPRPQLAAFFVVPDGRFSR
jgi:hypothetical protein